MLKGSSDPHLLLGRENFKVVYYSDDLAVLCSGRNLNHLSRLIERALDIGNWAEAHSLAVNM